MKKTITNHLFFAFLLLSTSAKAALQYWDVNGAAPDSGGPTPNGSTGSAVWDPIADGTGTPATWSSSSDTMVFSAGTDATGSYSVTISANITIAGIMINDGTVNLHGAEIFVPDGTVNIAAGCGLVQDSSARLGQGTGHVGSYILNGTSSLLQNTVPGANGSFISSSMGIVLNGGGTLSYTTGNTLSIVQTGAPGTFISGTGPLVYNGAGCLAIATASTYTGATIILNGELRCRTVNNCLPVATDVTVTSPGVLNLNTVNQQIGSLTGTGNVGTGAHTLTISGTSNTVFNGAIKNIANAGGGAVVSGSGSLVVTGGGTITFEGQNDISSSVTLSAGGIIVDVPASLCGPTANLAVNGGTLTFSNTAQTIANLNGSGGTIDLSAGNTLTSVPTASAVCSSIITGAGNFTYNGSGWVQTLNAACTYSGNTTITKGVLALGSTGSINNTANISIGAGAALDLSALPSPYNLSARTTLSASGTGTGVLTGAAILNGASGGVINLGSQPIILNYDGTDPALYVLQGSLTLNGNPFTINTATPLTSGTYLIAQQAGGTVTGSGTFAVTGTAIAPTYTGSIQISGANINLVVTPEPANATGGVNLGTGSVQLNFAGSPGQQYDVQWTSDLNQPITWTTLGTYTADGGGLFQATDSSSFPQRFYQTKSH